MLLANSYLPDAIPVRTKIGNQITEREVERERERKETRNNLTTTANKNDQQHKKAIRKQ